MYGDRSLHWSETASDEAAALQALARIAERHLSAAMDPFFTLVEELLFELADEARSQNEQRTWFDAMRILRGHKSSVIHDTLRDYRTAFESLGRPWAPTWDAASPETAFDLEILDDESLEEMIALDSMAHKARESCGRDLEFLCQRLEFLIGRTPEDAANPLLAEPLCDAFAAHLRELQLDQAPKLRVFRLFERHVIRQWPDLVAECNQYLASRGVLPELEKQKPRIRKQQEPVAEPARREPDADRPNTGGGDRRDDSGTERRRSDREAPFPPGLLAELHRCLHGSESGTGGDDDSGDSLVDSRALLDRLAGRQGGVGSGEGADDLELVREKGLEGAIAERLRACQSHYESLSSASRSIIRLLDQSFGRIRAVEDMAPAELNDLVLRLEFPVAGMALRDPGFLETLNHPGRRLVNEIFRVSATFLDGEEAADDPLRREVDKVIERLSALDVEPRELTHLLSEFIDFVERDKKRQALRERRLLEEEQASARAVQAHTEVHRALLERLQGRALPRFLVRFVETAWSKVLFLHALRDGVGGGAWQQGLGLLDDLLAEPPAAGDGALLEGLSERLHAISLAPTAIARWEKLLGRYLKGELPEEGHATESVTLNALLLDLPGVSLLDEQAAEDVDLRDLERVDALREGVWVEFRASEDSDPIRCKLAGVVKPVSKYVFTNRRGVKVAEASRLRLAARLRAGELRVLDNGRIFDRAFDAVVEATREKARRHRASGTA